MKNRLSDIAPLIVCSILIAAISQMVFKTFAVELPLGYATLLSFAFTFAFYIVLINKKIAIITLSLIVVSALIVYFRLNEVNKEAVQNFFTSSVAFLRNGEEIPILQVKILGAAIIFGISLIIIIPTITIPFFPATFAISIALILVLWKKQQTDLLAEASIIIGSLIIFFAHSMKNETNNSVKKIRNVSAAWLIPFAALICVIIVGVADNNKLNKKWKWLEVRTNIISDYIADITGNSAPRTIYDISKVGYQPLDGRLGGPVDLDDTEIFKYTSSARYELLLRGNIKNTYTGNNWVDDTVSYRSRMIDKFIDSQNNVFNLDLPDEEKRLSMYFDKIKVSIMPSADSSATIFAPNRTIDVEPSKFLTMLVSFNSEGEIFSSRDINKGIAYTLTVDHIKYNTDSFRDYVEQVQSNLFQEDLIADELIELNYTSQFEDLPESVSALALEITKGIESDYLKAVAIKKYLEKDFIYTLEPSIPPEDVDFVEYFLETKRGYCTYFATTMAVLARSAGLPSRYIEGFRANPVTQNKSYSVTGENAHAWAEIYIKGIGWIPFDPATRTETPEDSGPAMITEDEDMFEETSPAPEIVAEVEQGENKKFSIFYILIGILSFILILLCSILIATKIRTDIRFAKRRLKTINSTITFYYSEIMLILSYLNYEKPIGHTLNVYSNGVDNRIVLTEYSFKDVALIVSKMLYGQIDLRTDDIAYVYGYYKALGKYIIKNLGVFKYFYITTSISIKKSLQKD